MRCTAPWLAPGHVLLRRPDREEWRLITADGAVIEVDATVLAPRLTIDLLASDPGAAAELFAQAGYGPGRTQIRAEASGFPLGEYRCVGEVVVHGQGRIAAALARGVAGAGGTAVSVGGEVDRSAERHEPLIVVSCCDGPADASWCRLESMLRPDDVWLRVSVEGATAYYEPPTYGPVPVTHRMIRARRLAAAGWPEDLRALWTADLLSGPTLLTGRAEDLLVGWILADLAGIADGNTPSDRHRELRRLDLRTLEHTSHLVLPIPAGTGWREPSWTPNRTQQPPTAPRSAGVGWAGTIPAGAGAELYTVVVEPAHGDAGSPVLLWRTPYGTGAHLAEAFGWARRGLRVVLQDVRGRYNSTGDFRPYREEAADGLATVDWLRRNVPHSELIAYGGSYAAHCALELAGRTRLDGVLVTVPAIDHASCIRERNGAPRLYAHAHWWAEHGDSRVSRGPIAPLILDAPSAFDALPVTDLPDHWGLPLPGFAAAWTNSTGHPADRGVTALRARLDGSAFPAPPLLCLAGWADAFADDAIELWRHWPHPSARLAVGPWMHTLRPDPNELWLADTQVKAGALAASWARDEGGIRTAGGRLAVSAARSPRVPGTAEPGWRIWPENPPPHRELLLDNDLANNLENDPAGTFVADPHSPHPSRLGQVAVDDLLSRSDACVWWSPPQPAMEVVGAPAVLLRDARTTSTARAGWTVRLLLQAPGGPAVQLGTACQTSADSALRIELAATHVRLPAGSRLGIQVSGHQFPLYPRDPQDGTDPLTARTLRPARRSVGEVRLLVAADRETEPIEVMSRWPLR